jgi:lysophospholipase L1-like esterase
MKRLPRCTSSALLFAGALFNALPLAFGQPVAAPATATPPAPPAVDPFWPTDGTFAVPGRTSSWTGFRATNTRRRTLFAQRQDQDRDAVVFVGDSITEGWKTLDADFADLGVKVANRGIGGDTTPNLVYRLQEDVLSLRPRALVFLIGTNDLGEKTSPELIASNCRELHKRVRAAWPQIPVAWCLVMPRGDGQNDYPARIRDLNARINKFVATDPRATVCDTYTPFAQENGAVKPEAFNADRLHLNPTGYGVWRDAIKPIIAGWKLGAK